MNDKLAKRLQLYIVKNYKGEVSFDVGSISYSLSDDIIKPPKPKKTYSCVEYVSEKTSNKNTLAKLEEPVYSFNGYIDNIVLDETFSKMLLRKIDEKNITDVDCYTKARIDRRLFSKIRSDENYRPSKQTALSLAIALELPLKEFEEMLKKAGYALSDSNMVDVIVKFFIKNKIYDLFLIDEALLQYDQKTLTNY